MCPFFPNEVLEHIFQRLPVKSLIHCMSVCKTWKSIITNQSFILSHLSYNIPSTTSSSSSSNGSLLFQYSFPKQLTRWTREYEEFYSVYSDNQLVDHLTISKVRQCDFGLTMVGICNGLLCFADHYSVLLNDPTIFIMNPSIRKYAVLPKSIATLQSMKQYDPNCTVIGFGFDSKNMDFKVLKLVFHHLERVVLQADVYSLATGKWRNITDKVPSLISFRWQTKKQVFVNGALHWIVYGDNHNKGEFHSLISSFDLTKETFGELMLPQCLDLSYCSVELSLFTKGNSLALARCKRLNKVYIWVMKEYGIVSSWDLMISFDSSHYGGILSRVIGMRNNGDMVLQTSDRSVILWDPEEDSVKDLGLEGCTVSFVGDQVESLVLINQENNVSFH